MCYWWYKKTLEEEYVTLFIEWKIDKYITNTEKTMIKIKSHNTFNVGEEIIYMDG